MFSSLFQLFLAFSEIHHCHIFPPTVKNQPLEMMKKSNTFEFYFDFFLNYLFFKKNLKWYSIDKFEQNEWLKKSRMVPFDI